MKKIKIGSRKSRLALWQSESVAHMMNRRGIETEIITMDTIGDKKLDTPIAEIGGKGVFTEEIEAALKHGDLDMAVHSAKDMPSRLPEGFFLIAFTERERANDVLVSSADGPSLEDTADPLRIGTSSVRRTALLKHFYPHVKTVNIRGNLQTRIHKMETGECDALLLAYAGVKRMQYDHMIVRHMPVTQFVPPVGQGSMAVEVYDSIDANLKAAIRNCVNHAPTEVVITAERAYLKTLQGGCSIPAFAYARYVGEAIRLIAGLVSPDGRILLKEELTGRTEEAAELGEIAGLRILQTGGKEILDELHGFTKNEGGTC
ncbi:MAG: hydroxymethylbilane synthase [Desulfobacterales bacterium]